MSEPFHLVYQLCREANAPGFRFLERLSLEDENTNPVEKVADYVRMKAASASKLNTYVTDMNPNMTVHPVYVTKVFIPDFKRVIHNAAGDVSQPSSGGWEVEPHAA